MNGVTSIDTDSLRGEVGKVNINISTTAGTYQDEFLTTNYITNVFSAIESVKTDWENSVIIAEGYARRIEETASIEPEPPLEYPIEGEV